jgi:hypothetical protein
MSSYTIRWLSGDKLGLASRGERSPFNSGWTIGLAHPSVMLRNQISDAPRALVS